MLRVSFGLFTILALLASPSTANAGSIIPSGSGATLIGGTLFETDETRLKFALLNGGDSSGFDNPFTSLPDPSAASPLIAGEVIFTMINVGFQVGADGIEPKLPAGMRAPASIPEPATLLLLASGIGLAMRKRLTKKVAR